MAIRLVLGLGNPGARYADTRHNVGFRVVDELVRRHGAGGWEHRLPCDLGTLDLGDGVLVAKPLTYMNRSGSAFRWLLDRFDLEAGQTLVAVDDVDLPLGRLRLRKRGGPGTHNGLRDLCEEVGIDFPRLRVGVRGVEPWKDLAAYVTEPFDECEIEIVNEAVRRAADAAEAVITDGLDAAMNVFNRVAEEV